MSEFYIRQFSEVTVWVVEANTRARRFYKHLGFRLELNQKKVFDPEDMALPKMRYRWVGGSS
jgi:RimJ/RimL family protein N-acetyltransferase